MKDDLVYLRHIAECLRRIDKNIAIGLDAFLESETIQDATPAEKLPRTDFQ